MRRQRAKFDIAPVLEALTGEEVPRIFGEKFSMCRCPFHPDRRPSAAISQEAFRCFSCGRYGVAVTLLMREEGLSARDAYRRAKEITRGEGHSDVSAGGGAERLPDLSWH